VNSKIGMMSVLKGTNEVFCAQCLYLLCHNGETFAEERLLHLLNPFFILHYA
jgi:hypothetical protein